ncbi:MAG: TolC family protein [Bacteroidales bacterium]|nr:TolC family protein [Bacteroidales bacterium]
MLRPKRTGLVCINNKFRVILLSLTLLGTIMNVSVCAQEVETGYSLRQLIDTALHRSYLLHANKKNTKIRQSEIEILKKNYQPVINTSASFSTWKFLMPNKQRVLGDALTDFYTDISIRQTIYDWGETKLRKEVVEDEILLNEAVSGQIRKTIMLGVADAFFEVLKAEAEVEAYRNSITQLRSHLQYAENLYRIGKVSGVDVLKIEVQVLVEEKNLQRALDEVTAQKIKIKRICYLQDNAEIELSNVSDSLYKGTQSLLFDPDSLYMDVLQNDPALLSADLDIKKQDKQKDILRLQSRPEIYSFGIGTWEHGYIPFSDNFNYNLGLGISYTIPWLGGNSYKTRILQSNLRVEQLNDEKNQILTDIKKDIDVTLNLISQLKNEITNYERIIALSNETLENALVTYKSGQGTIIDVLDAQAILTETTITRGKSILSCLQAIARLHYLTGNTNYPF